MRKFLKWLSEKRFSLFEMWTLGILAIGSVFLDNYIIVIPGVILIIVLQIILTNLLEETK